MRRDNIAFVRYVIIRFLFLIISVFFTLTLVFIATRVAHLNIWSRDLRFPHSFGYVFNEYIQYLTNIITKWDWGTWKYPDNRPVMEVLAERAPITIKLNLIAFAFYFSFGISLGIISAIKVGSWFDKVSNGFFIVVGSIPSFIWIFVLILVFGYMIPILPPQPPSVQTPLYWQLLGWVMPVLALSLAPIAKFATMMRNELVDNLNNEHLLLLRTKGLTRRQAITRHLIRESFIPVMPEIAPTFVFVVVGSFFVEQIYNMSGASWLFLRSMFAPGYGSWYITIHTPMTVLISVFYATFTLVFLFFVDLMYAIVDPRVSVIKPKR